jgi:hypothetical protein
VQYQNVIVSNAQNNVFTTIYRKPYRINTKKIKKRKALMHYHILPQNFESPMPMLTVIGYSSGRLIAISEEGKLFYMKCDESLFEPGTVLEKDDMLPVSILPDAQKIYESFNIDWRPEHE